MSSLKAKDRVSLCSFTFSDGRRCRTPRIGNHPHFCFYHTQKEARAHATQTLGKDLAYFFSGDYLSACDLSTALGRLIPAVVRGDVKPRTARTVAYLAQTLLQSIHFTQHEYINAFGSDGWRNAISNSVNDNHDYRFPPKPAPTTTGANSPGPAQPESLQPQPASPRAPMPPTSAEFVQQVVARLQTGSLPTTPPSNPPHPAPVAHPFRGDAFPSVAPPPQPAVIPNPVASLANGGEGPASSSTPALSPTATPASQTPANCHSERREESAFSESPADPQINPTAARPHSIQATQPAQPAAPPAQPDNPPPTAPPAPKPVQPLDSRALHYDHNYRLFIDGKPF